VGSLALLWLGAGLAAGYLPGRWGPSRRRPQEYSEETKLVLDTAQGHWLAALRQHTLQEEPQEEEGLLQALYPAAAPYHDPGAPPARAALHYLCCARGPGRPVHCLPHEDWHVRREEAARCNGTLAYDVSFSQTREPAQHTG
jgi:hypothetical protein